jgi:hypothetical protein
MYSFEDVHELFAGPRIKGTVPRGGRIDNARARVSPSPGL